MLSQRIKMLRLARGVSQVDMAKALGVTKQSVSNWENDNIQPSIDMLSKLADYFAVSTDYLLGRSDQATLLIEGLTPTQRSHVQAIIDDILGSQKG